MQLPQIQKKESIKALIGGVELTFHRASLADLQIVYDEFQNNKNEMRAAVKAIALLMDGYDEPIEKRIEYINSLEVDSIGELQKELSSILEKLGLSLDSVKKN